MTQTLEPTRRSYTKPEVERALAELAITGNRPRVAARRLEEAGLDVPATTLCYWRDESHAQLYEEIKTEIAPRIREVVADECEALAIAYAQKEAETLQGLEPDKLDQRDRASAIRNLATAKAINVDKAQLLRDRPTAIVQKLGAEELLRSLGTLDGTAEDVTDAAVVDQDTGHGR